MPQSRRNEFAKIVWVFRLESGIREAFFADSILGTVDYFFPGLLTLEFQAIGLTSGEGRAGAWGGGSLGRDRKVCK